MFSNYNISPKAMKYFNLGYTYQMNGQYDQAEINYKKSIEIEPSAEAHTFLGWTYSFMGELDKAIEQCKTAISVDPDFGNPYNDIGAYLLQLGKLNSAIPWLEKAKKAKRYENPEYAYCNLGQVYEFKGSWQKARQEYQGALDINKDYMPAKVALIKLKANLN